MKSEGPSTQYNLSLASVTLKLTLLLWLVCRLVAAQNRLSAADRAEILRAHNSLRSMVRPRGRNIQRLRYNEELAMVAQSFAEQCVFGPNPDRATMADSFATVGQNALVTNSRTVDYRALIRDNWFSQQTEYNFDTDTCRSVCNEYRQLVWAETTRVGCGVARCPEVQGFPLPNALVLICNYAPEGDIPGERPYIRGMSCSQCPSNRNTCINRLCSFPPPATEPPSTPPPPTTQPPTTRRPPRTSPAPTTSSTTKPCTLPLWLIFLKKPLFPWPAGGKGGVSGGKGGGGGGFLIIDGGNGGDGDDNGGIEPPDVVTERSRGSSRVSTRSRSRGPPSSSRGRSPGGKSTRGKSTRGKSPGSQTRRSRTRKTKSNKSHKSRKKG